MIVRINGLVISPTYKWGFLLGSANPLEIAHVFAHLDVPGT